MVLFDSGVGILTAQIFRRFQLDPGGLVEGSKFLKMTFALAENLSNQSNFSKK